MRESASVSPLITHETDVGNVTNIDETDVGNVTNIDETDVGNVTNIDETTVGMRPAESDVDMRPTDVEL